MERSEYVKGLRAAVGFGLGLIPLALLVWLCWLAYDTRQAAIQGRAAFEFIQRVNAPQQPAAAAPAPK